MKKISNFEYLRSLSVDGLAEWFDSNIWNWENTPWIEWFDNTYCNKCEPEMEFSWCELNGKCKFFQNLDDVPDDRQVVKLWLESEV